jgi:hypothetical protein
MSDRRLAAARRPSLVLAVMHGTLVTLLLVLAAPWARGVVEWILRSQSRDIGLSLVGAAAILGLAIVEALLVRNRTRGGSAWPLAAADGIVSVAAWWVGWVYLLSQSPVVVIAFLATLVVAPTCLVLVLAGAAMERGRRAGSPA